jgi:hypothetical protein
MLSDVYSLNIPWKYAARVALERHEWPLWNPYSFCGDILAASAQPTPYEPFFLLSLLLPMANSLTFMAAITFFLAGLLMFAFLRELRCSEAAVAQLLHQPRPVRDGRCDMAFVASPELQPLEKRRRLGGRQSKAECGEAGCAETRPRARLDEDEVRLRLTGSDCERHQLLCQRATLCAHLGDVFHELGPDYYSATSQTFIGRVYKLFGFRNIADAADTSHTGYPQLSGEYILKANPQMVVLSDSVCCAQSASTVAAPSLAFRARSPSARSLSTSTSAAGPSSAHAGGATTFQPPASASRL